MMNKIREWGFPIVLMLSWVCASAYTVSRLTQAQLPTQSTVSARA